MNLRYILKVHMFLIVAILLTLVASIFPSGNVNFQEIDPSLLNTTGEKQLTMSYEDFLRKVNLKEAIASSLNISVDIPYQRPEGLEIYLGQEISVNGQVIQGKSEKKVWTPLEAMQMNQTKGFEITLLKNTSFKTIPIRKEINYSVLNYGDLPSKVTGSRWYLRIVTNDTIDYGYNDTEKGEHLSCHGYLDSFKISIGGFFFRSLDLPMFGQGWDVKARISGIGAEVLRMPRKTPQIKNNCVNNQHPITMRVASDTPNWDDDGSVVRGAAAIIAVSNYKYREDTDRRPDANNFKSKLLETGLYKVRWLLDNGPSGSGPWIDDEQIEDSFDLLDTDTSDDDIAILYINTHGGHYLNGDGIESGLSWVSLGGLGHLFEGVLEYEFRDNLGVITSGSGDTEVQLFYWMMHCGGQLFNDLWTTSSCHNSQSIFWYYDDTGYSDREDEINYFFTQSFGLMRSVEDTHEVVASVFSYYHAGEGDVLRMQDTSTNDVYLIEDLSDNFCCRTRGEPSTGPTSGSYAYYWGHSDGNWLASEDSYWRVGEIFGTFDRYVGTYFNVRMPLYGNSIDLTLDIRATSDYSGGSRVTNWIILVYSSDWSTRLDYKYYNYILKDTGWRVMDGHDPYTTIHFEWQDPWGNPEVNVFIGYNDAWSHNWQQNVYFRNINAVAY